MTTTTQFPAPRGPAAALRELLARLVEQNVVDGVVVPLPQPGTGQITQALVKDVELLRQAQPLAPVMPVNSARLATRLAGGEGQERLAIVLRPCEERALVELVKLRQASLDKIFPVVIDCGGATSPAELARRLADTERAARLDQLAEATLADSPPTDAPPLRAGCAICADFVPGRAADIAIHLFGHEGTIGVRLSERLEERASALGLEAMAPPPDRERRVAALKATREKDKEELLSQLGAMEKDVAVLLDAVGGCLRCGNCQRACPICFCRRCTFETPMFEHEQNVYLRRAERRGAARLPDDVALFHMTRLAHVAMSCVSCGSCEAVCPADIPLTGLFAHVGRRVRRPFEYEPGRTVDEELPLATFEHDELEPQ